MITTLLFDIHEVFLVESKDVYERIAADFGVTTEDINRAVAAHWGDYRCGCFVEDTYWQRVCASLPRSFSGRPEELRDRMDVVDPLDNQLTSLVRAMQARYRVAALSNAGADLERRLAHFGILDLFHPLINSYRVGLAKPDERVYQLASDLVNTPPSNILFVDDKVRNTSVAERMGFQTHVYTDVSAFKQYLATHALWP